MLMFGLAGALLSFGAWFVLYRYWDGVAEAADVHLECTEHCGGVDGPYLVAMIISVLVAIAGVVIASASFSRTRSAEQ